MDSPTVSVILTTHSWDRYDEFRDALRSVEAQTYDDVEIVTPFDADPELADRTESIAEREIVTGYDPEIRGLSAARNFGAELASGDVYAFLDDDCVADPGWVEALVAAYEDGALAAGGPAYPAWPGDGDRPRYLPQQFDWLVGAGPYCDDDTEVRNTYGCNISFRADVFDDLGGFDENLGKQTGSLAQGEEADLCRRLRDEYDRGVRYRADAAVEHLVYPDQLSPGYLLKRAYAHGQTKRVMGVDDEETGFLRAVAGELVRQHPAASVAALGYVFVTGMGYLRGPDTGSALSAALDR